jgi:hypothetical protein
MSGHAKHGRHEDNRWIPFSSVPPTAAKPVTRAAAQAFSPPPVPQNGYPHGRSRHGVDHLVSFAKGGYDCSATCNGG